MKENPNFFSDDFEFIIMNDDQLHESEFEPKVRDYFEKYPQEEEVDIQYWVEKVKKAVAKAPIITMSLRTRTNYDTGYWYENNKILIPDNYQLEEDWCTTKVKMAFDTMKIWPWENKIEKGIFRGFVSGMNYDYIPYS